MRKKLTFLILATIIWAGCNSEKQKQNSGISYKILADKAGPVIKQGDFVSANIITSTDADSIISNTYATGVPKLFILPRHQFIGDLSDVMKSLSEGDSVTAKFPADSVFKNNPKPPYFKGNFVKYTLKVEKVIPRDNLTDQLFQKSIDDYLDGVNQVKKNAEQQSIKKYIKDNKLKVSKTDSGLYYVITKKGHGPVPLKNDTVIINYTAKLLNGKMFDTNVFEEADKAKIIDNSRDYAPMGIPVGQHKIIAGWEQSLLMLNKDAEATFIIPSQQAYGVSGARISGITIPAFRAVVYDLQIVNIVHPKPPGKTDKK